MSSYLDLEGLGVYHGKNKEYIDGKIPTKTSDLTNDSGFVTESALNAKAPLASPTLTGTPKAPTATAGTNTTQIATTAFVQTAVSNLVNGAPETMNTLKELSDAIEEHQDITDALNSAITNKVDKVSGKGLSTNDYTTTEKTKLSGIATGAEVNQNTFSNVKVGTTTISADSKTDTLELVAGDNITITPDATNDKITISSTGGGSDTISSLADLGITATVDELNYVDGVTSNIQTQLNGKANSSHGHSDKLPVSTTTATYTTLADFWTHCDSIFKSTNSRTMMGRAKLTTFTPLDGWFRYLVSAQNTLGNGEWAITGSIILDNGGKNLYRGIVDGGITDSSDLSVSWNILGGSGTTVYKQTSEPTVSDTAVWIPI